MKKNPEEKSFNLKTHVTCGFVCKASLADWEGIKEIIRTQFPSVYVFYQKACLGRLYLVEKGVEQG